MINLEALVGGLLPIRWNWTSGSVLGKLELLGLAPVARAPGVIIAAAGAAVAEVRHDGDRVVSVTFALAELASDGLDETALGAAHDELNRVFFSSAKWLEGAWNKPVFFGVRGSVGFPKMLAALWAHWAAAWPVSRCCIALTLGDGEAKGATRLSLVILPPQPWASLAAPRHEVPAYVPAASLVGERPLRELVASWHERALAYVQVAQLEDALSLFAAIVTYAPFWATGWNDKGYCLSLMQRHDLALACFDAALRRSQTQVGAARALRNKAQSLAALGQVVEAAACYEQITASSPTDALAWYQKGMAERMAGLDADAVASLSRFCELAPPEMAGDVAQVRSWLAAPRT